MGQNSNRSKSGTRHTNINTIFRLKHATRSVTTSLSLRFRIIDGRSNVTLHTQSALSDGHHLSSVCRRQLPQPGGVLGFPVLLELTAAGGVAADGAEELVFIRAENVRLKRRRASGGCVFQRSSSPLVSASFRASLLSSRLPPVIINCHKTKRRSGISKISFTAKYQATLLASCPAS